MKKSFPIVYCVLPGTRGQLPVTQAVRFEEAFVTAVSKRAVHLRIPAIKRSEWIARSQLCERGDDGVEPDIDRFSEPGAFGRVHLPLFIVKRWGRAKKEGAAAETATAPKSATKATRKPSR